MKTISYFPLQIECVGGEQLGMCYYATYYIVKSFNRQISEQTFNTLFDSGFFGHGQYFSHELVGTEPYDKSNKYYVYKATCKCDSGD